MEASKIQKWRRKVCYIGILFMVGRVVVYCEVDGGLSVCICSEKKRNKKKNKKSKKWCMHGTDLYKSKEIGTGIRYGSRVCTLAFHAW